jgi:hypothetical protein
MYVNVHVRSYNYSVEKLSSCTYCIEQKKGHFLEVHRQKILKIFSSFFENLADITANKFTTPLCYFLALIWDANKMLKYYRYKFLNRKLGTYK